MGVYIKGMEMPTSCPCELLGIGYDLYCSFVGGIPARLKEYYECCQNGTRPPWCPLVPVPPHGKSIDVDALIRELEITEEDERNGATLLMAVFLEVLKSAPTIIQAEEDET